MFVKKFQNKQSTTSNESKEDDKKNWIVLAESTEKKILATSFSIKSQHCKFNYNCIFINLVNSERKQTSRWLNHLHHSDGFHLVKIRFTFSEPN